MNCFPKITLLLLVFSYTNFHGIIKGQVSEAPSDLTAVSYSCSQMLLTWTDNANNEDAFGIERRTDSDEFTEIAILPVNTTSFTDYNLKANTHYTYRIRAYNPFGTSDYSSEASSVTLSASSPPTAPSGLIVQITSPTLVSLAWTDNSNNEDEFKIEQKIGSGYFAEIVRPPLNSTTWSLTNLTPGTNYTYRIRAYNAGGFSEYSNELQVTTPALACTKIYFNCKDGIISPASAPWNNSQILCSGGILNNLTDDRQQVTQVGIQFIDPWAGTNAYGMTTGIYQPEVVRSAYYIDDDNQHRIRIFGLDTANKYTFTFFASRNATGNRTTQYTIENTTVELNASNNTDNTVQITGVRPNLSGEVFILVNRQLGALYGYLNALIIASENATLHSPTSLTATAVSGTQVNLTWKDNATSETGFLIERCLGSGDCIQLNSIGPNVTDYSDKNLKPGIIYTYQVRAYNEEGISDKSNSVSITTLPNTPVAVDASDITKASFTANWNEAEGATGYTLDIAKDHDFSNILADYNHIDIKSGTSLSVTGLVPVTTYYYRVTAYNKGGHSDPSDIITLVTLPNAPVAPIATNASDITKTSFTANWNEVESATGYILDIATDPGFANMLADYNHIDIKSGTSLSVTGLVPVTTYYYRVTAYNKGGYSDLSDIITLVTLPNAPVAPIATNASDITKSSFTANWNEAEGATGYTLDVATDHDFSNILANYNHIDIKSGTSLSVTGLVPVTTYYYRVTAYNKGGTSNPSNIKTLVTLPSAPVAPIAIDASDITKTSFTANWNEVEGANGYILDIATDPGFANMLADYNHVDIKSGTSLSITGLIPANYYYYRVRAYNSGGASGNSNIITILSLGTSVQEIKNHCVTISVVADAAIIESTEIIRTLEIVDDQGRIIVKKSVRSTTTSVNMEGWKPGIYIFILTTTNGIIVKKILVMK